MTRMTSQPTDSLSALLEQLLAGGQNALTDAKTVAREKAPELSAQAKSLGKQGEDLLIDKLGLEDNDQTRDMIRTQAKYAGMAGALALLLKSRSARKLATLGGLGALGMIAYRGHQRGEMPKDFKDAIGLLRGEPAEVRADILIKAMIAAARADGEVSDKEQALIEAYPGADLGEMQNWLGAPADAASIAALATSDQVAAEIYAVSARVADGINPKERDYLDRLAMALRLDPEVAARIETDVRVA